MMSIERFLFAGIGAVDMAGKSKMIKNRSDLRLRTPSIRYHTLRLGSAGFPLLQAPESRMQTPELEFLDFQFEAVDFLLR